MLLVGHVTKDGAIAGPRVLEHMVDTVLYFEGERGHQFRILRAVKNRFGPTDEIGVFEMSDRGLADVANPSALFLGERRGQVSGACVFAGIEGTRPLLVEIQALVDSSYGNPRRLTVAIGEGAKKQIEAQFTAMGTNLLILLPGSSTASGVRGGSVWCPVDMRSRSLTRIALRLLAVWNFAGSSGSSQSWTYAFAVACSGGEEQSLLVVLGDRKSTRLNSSH